MTNWGCDSGADGYCSSSSPGRSMSLLFVPRQGEKWSDRYKLRGWSAGELSLLIWSKQKRWHTQNLTHGWRSTCAASLCDLDRTQTQKQHYCLKNVKPSFPVVKCKRYWYRLQYSVHQCHIQDIKWQKSLKLASLNAFISTLIVALHDSDCKYTVWWKGNLMSSL